MLLFYRFTASRYSSNKVHTCTHMHTHAHTDAHFFCLCVFVCFIALQLHATAVIRYTHCFIASQYALNQLRLQQYTSPTVYVSSKLALPSLPLCSASWLQFASKAACGVCRRPRPSAGTPSATAAAVSSASSAPATPAPASFPAPTPLHAPAAAGLASAPVAVAAGVPLKAGDWLCSGCGDLQFARNKACRRCGAGKPGSMFALFVASEYVVSVCLHMEPK